MSADENTAVHDPFAQVGPGDDAPSGLGSDTAAHAAVPPPAPTPETARRPSPQELMAQALATAGNTPEEVAAADRANAVAAGENPAEVIGTPEWAAAQEAAGLVRHAPEGHPAATPQPAPQPAPAVTADLPPMPSAPPAGLPDGTGPVTPDPPREEAERFDPAPTGPITLEDGSEVEVVPMKLRETMRLLRIVTHGTGPFLGQLLSELTTLGDERDDADTFAQTMLLTVLTSIPDAEQEAIDFIGSMVRPAGWDRLSADNRQALDTVLNQYMANPSLEDTTAIIERIIRRESEDLRGLGKRIAAAANMTRRVTKPQTMKKTV